MSSSYASETPIAQRAPRYRHPQYYAPPPRTPSTASSAQLGSSTAIAPASSHGRKRTRGDDLDRGKRSSLPVSSASVNRKRTHANHVTDSRTSSERTASPPPFVNTKYRLAGGLDTPTAARENAFEELYNETEDNFRRRWSTTSSRVDYDSNGRQTVSINGLERGGNGRKRSRADMESAPAATSASWGNYVYSVVGGIWNFCWNNPFRGFSSGGGTSYNMQSSRPQRRNSADSWSTIEQAGNGHRRERARETRTPIPGEFPQDDEDDYAGVDQHTEELESRPAKRRQTTQGNDWVMVDHNDLTTSSGTRISARKLGGSRILSGARPVASRKARVSSGRVPSVSHAGSPYLAKDRAASTAIPRSPSQYHEQPSPQSPPSVEIQRFEAQRKKEERRNDASIKKMSQQLNALINEGKKALATKVAVEDDDI